MITIINKNSKRASTSTSTTTKTIEHALPLTRWSFSTSWHMFNQNSCVYIEFTCLLCLPKFRRIWNWHTFWHTCWHIWHILRQTIGTLTYSDAHTHTHIQANRLANSDPRAWSSASQDSLTCDLAKLFWLSIRIGISALAWHFPWHISFGTQSDMQRILISVFDIESAEAGWATHTHTVRVLFKVQVQWGTQSARACYRASAQQGT